MRRETLDERHGHETQRRLDIEQTIRRLDDKTFLFIVYYLIYSLFTTIYSLDSCGCLNVSRHTGLVSRLTSHVPERVSTREGVSRLNV